MSPHLWFLRKAIFFWGLETLFLFHATVAWMISAEVGYKGEAWCITAVMLRVAFHIMPLWWAHMIVMNAGGFIPGCLFYQKSSCRTGKRVTGQKKPLDWFWHSSLNRVQYFTKRLFHCNDIFLNRVRGNFCFITLKSFSKTFKLARIHC